MSIIEANGSTTSSPIAAAYFPEWGIYERDYTVADVPADQLTHLIYAFTDVEMVNGQYQIGLFDEWAATQVPFNDANSVDGVGDVAGQGLMGNFNQLVELKEANPHLTIMIGIGGWTLSQNFSDMAATVEGRDVFTNSVIEFLKQYPVFDGIDWDWEYPGGGGLASNSVRPEDGQNYALLLAEMREKLDTLQLETGEEYQQSVAAPAGSDKIANFNADGLAPHIDFFNVMAYDFYGAWQNTTGHLAGMYDPSGAGYDVTTAIDLYLQNGIDPGQIVLGLPSFSRAWQGVDAESPIDAWNSPSGGGAPGTYPASEPAYYEYKDLLALVSEDNSTWGVYYDDEAQAAFLYDPTTGIFSSFETPSTISIKSEWAQSLGLGGFMFWDLSGDSNGPESLISAAFASWYEGRSFEEIDSASSIEFDGVFGGDGIVSPIAEADTDPQPLPGDNDNDTPPTDQDDDNDGEAPPTDSDSDDNETGGEDPSEPPADGGNGAPVNGGLGTAGVNRSTADVAITYNGSQDLVIDDFDPSSGTIFFDWYNSAQLEISSTDAGVLIAVPHIRQTWLLTNVSLSDLSPANFSFLDASAAAEVFAVIGQDGNDDPDESDDPQEPDDQDSGDDAGDGGDSQPPNTGGEPTQDLGLGTAGVTRATADVAITYNGSQTLVIDDFDPASGTIFVDWYSSDQLEVSQTAEGVLFALPQLRQTWLLADVDLSELSAANFTFLDRTAANEVLALVGEGQSSDGSGDGSDGDNSGDHDGDGSSDGDGDHNHDGSGDHGGDGGMGMDHLHVTITPTSASRTIDGFDPTVDVIEVTGGISGNSFEIFEENGDALGTTVRIAIYDGNGQVTSTTIFTGIGLSDLTIGNFSIDDQMVLNEVASALGITVVAPDTGGYIPVPDTDGSSPPATSGTTEQGGTKYIADVNADDIVGFDPSSDEFDFGSTSVHAMIVTKTEDGFVAIDSPWSDALQIVQGVTYQDTDIDVFGLVGNEHFRQDMGAVVSWELGIGPAFGPAPSDGSQTVYVRSHEYGVHEVVTDFNIATDKISFLYFGTRERLTVEDTEAGLQISSLPTGQSVTIAGISLSDLVPGQVEFHHDQVMEDNLETAFGFDQNSVTLIDRTVLLTPEGPAGQVTDGFQVRQGDFGDGAGQIEIPNDDDDATNNGAPYVPVDVPDGGTVEIGWAWAERAILTGFDPATDKINLGTMGPDNFQITAAEDGDLEIEVLGNGGQVYRFDGLTADEAQNLFVAPDWNTSAIEAALSDLDSLL